MTSRRLYSEFGDDDNDNDNDVQSSPPPPLPPNEEMNSNNNNCHILRRLIRNSMEHHLLTSAVFYADKLVSITNDDDDIHLLAETYIMDKQFRRAVLMMKQRGMLSKGDLKFDYLAALCMAEVNEWEACLLSLGMDDDSVVHRLDEFERTIENHSDDVAKINLASAACVVRGRAYEAMENHTKRVFWLQEALRRDAKCVEAFESLVDKRSLKYEQESRLLPSMKVPESLNWLKLVYEAKIDQYKYRTNLVVDKLTTLQQEYGISDNLDLHTSNAHFHFQRHRFEECYAITKEVMKSDPYHLAIIPVHLCVMVELNLKSELYYCAHQLVEGYPNKAVSWFGVGCYYYLCSNFDTAWRYFKKSTTMDTHFAASWIGIGHAYSALDESDQALSAYRTASRLFEGSHLPLLYIGMEYVLNPQNQALASQCFTQAHAICPIDPMVYNEIGIVSYNDNDFDTALHYFKTALELMCDGSNAMKETVLMNLGHTYRKLHEYDVAIETFRSALGMTSTNANIYAAIGFTFHIKGDLTQTVDNYHKALGIQPRDTFVNDMLTRAFCEMVQGGFDWTVEHQRSE